MFGWLKSLLGFGEKQVEVAKPEETVKAEPAKCGCGRSPSGFCTGLHALTDAEWATHADNPNKVVEVSQPIAKEVKAAKKPTAKATTAKATTAKASATKAKTTKPKTSKK